MEGILSAGRPDPATLISEAVKRLVFFVLSLDHIAKQGDRYKFFFHNNIIIHELVRLERLIQGDVSYHYLPKQVFESSALGLADLSFSFHDDMEEHIRKVRSMVHIFLKESNLLGKNIHLSSSDSKQKLDSSI